MRIHLNIVGPTGDVTYATEWRECMTCWKTVVLVTCLVGLAPMNVPARANEVTPLKIKPWCATGGKFLIVHTIIDSEYESIDLSKPNRKRVLDRSHRMWHMDCNLETKECSGAFLSPDHIERGDPMSYGDLMAAVGLRVVSQAGNVFIVQFGEYATYTIDLDRGIVEERWSSPTSKGGGIGKCTS